MYESCAGIVRHEVLHIIRSMNAVFNEIEKSQVFLPTEEGLASYVQNYKGAEENYSLYQHAARYSATDVALKGSFRDVVEYLLSIGFEEKLAFRRAVRHKSGFIDTSQPGDIMKSSMYFYNLQRIKQLTDSEILRLFVGKIGIEDLPQHREYKGKIDAQKIILFYKLTV